MGHEHTHKASVLSGIRVFDITKLQIQLEASMTLVYTNLHP